MTHDETQESEPQEIAVQAHLVIDTNTLIGIRLSSTTPEARGVLTGLVAGQIQGLGLGEPRTILPLDSGGEGNNVYYSLVIQ